MPAYPVSGITGLPSSGTLPASGSQSGFDGPWLIETQDLTIQYVRVPMLASATSVVNSLSAVNTRSMSVVGTGLQAIIRASYRRFREDNTTYSTSTWTQPQRFTIQPQATDAFGNSYGTVSGATLGPGGRIVTSQPWYRRVPWTSATSATQIIEAVTVANAPYMQLQRSPGVLQFVGTDAIASFGKFDPAAVAPGMAHAFTSIWQEHMNNQYVQYLGYSLPGSYNTTLESQVEFRAFVDSIGYLIQINGLWPIVSTCDPVTGVSAPTQGIQYYRPERHDYT